MRGAKQRSFLSSMCQPGDNPRLGSASKRPHRIKTRFEPPTSTRRLLFRVDYGFYLRSHGRQCVSRRTALLAWKFTSHRGSYIVVPARKGDYTRCEEKKSRAAAHEFSCKHLLNRRTVFASTRGASITPAFSHSSLALAGETAS